MTSIQNLFPTVIRNFLKNLTNTAKISVLTGSCALAGTLMTSYYLNKILTVPQAKDQKRLKNNANKYTIFTCVALGLSLASSVMTIFNSNIPVVKFIRRR